MKNTLSKYSQHQILENQKESNYNYYDGLKNLSIDNQGNIVDRLRAFPIYVPVNEISKFIAKRNIQKKVVNIHGSVVKCRMFTE